MMIRIVNTALSVDIDLPDGLDARRHRDEIARIRSVHSHTISFVELPEEGNCITYALGFINEPEYRAAETNAGHELARAKFVKWLLNGRLREIAKPSRGCLIMYFRSGAWQHVGILTDADRVMSKWGRFPIYQHAISEVPARYGDEIRFFEHPGRHTALQLILQYARERRA